jgi:transcriptional regulator with XRE-family HTH domain
VRLKQPDRQKSAISGDSDNRDVSSRESRVDRGRRRGREIVRQVVAELVGERRAAGVSQDRIAAQLGTSQSEISRLERLVTPDAVSAVDLCAYGALLGFDLVARLYRNSDEPVDAGHQKLIARFTAQLHPSWRVGREIPLPHVGDRRSWDLLLRLADHIVGIEAETRVRDVQRLVRRLRERQRDGGAHRIVLALADTAANRRVVPELIEALGPEFQTSARDLLGALRRGVPLSGSDVVVL